MKKLRSFRLLGGHRPLRLQQQVTASSLAQQARVLELLHKQLDFLVGYWVSQPHLPEGFSWRGGCSRPCAEQSTRHPVNG